MVNSEDIRDDWWDDENLVEMLTDEEIRNKIYDYYHKTKEKKDAKPKMHFTTFNTTDKKEKVNLDDVKSDKCFGFTKMTDYDNNITTKAEYSKNIILTRKCYLKILAHVRLLASECLEVGGLLKIKQDNKKLIVHDIVMLEQDVSSGRFEFNDDALINWHMKNRTAKDKHEVWGWFHSHHTMGRFWSGTDDTCFEQLSERISLRPTQCLGLVFTSDGKFLTRYDVNTPVGRMTMDKLKVHVGLAAEKKIGKKQWNKIYHTYFTNAKKYAKKNISKTVYITRSTNVKYIPSKARDRNIENWNDGWKQYEHNHYSKGQYYKGFDYLD